MTSHNRLDDSSRWKADGRLQEANIDRLNGLSRSPDHNSIQYVWDGLRKAISQPNSLPWTPCELKVPLL
ncbi:hypothetical protein TNCV_275521 [Trichonephila clavipes]|nr:hypothetical protein TNCV_275521 [Trichonephila clavipes]